LNPSSRSASGSWPVEAMGEQLVGDAVTLLD
jgi:hypothetical protein